MPPQPISNTAFYRKQSGRAKFMGWIRSPRPFDMRPTLGTPFANVMATCASLEHDLGVLLIAMTGRHSWIAMAIHGELTSTSSQLAALRGAANAVLPERELNVFEVVIGIAQSAIFQRNKVAHGLWAFNQEWPDAMLLLDADESYAGEIMFASGDERPKSPSYRKPLGWSAERVFIYRSKEFEEITTQIMIATNLVRMLKALVEAKDQAKDELYVQLLAVPAIREALSRKLRRRKNNPKGRE